MSSPATDNKNLLRFITCGSVDDGKSTLIGRLLFDSGLLLEDQIRSLRRDSRRYGTTNEEPDLALLTDGLLAEREQGITIDVAYRFFATSHRKFVVADTPGHEQYTRNMATGASTADLAVLLVDARKGILAQTRRHAFITWLLGIQHMVLAVNKMDLVEWDIRRFAAIEEEFRRFSINLGVASVAAVPISARGGDNVTGISAAMPWYSGPSLLQYLETVEVPSASGHDAFRLPVQLVNRPNSEFRGYCGMVAGGNVRLGDKVVIAPSGRPAEVKRIVTYDGDLQQASAGQSVTLVLTQEIDVARGDVIAAATAPLHVADQFCAHLVWMHEDPMLPGRQYLLRIGPAAMPARVTELKHRIDISTLGHEAAKKLNLNEIGLCNIAVDHPVPFDPYEQNRDTGSFILVDRMTNETVGAGMIRFALRRSTNVTWQPVSVDKQARARIKGHQPCVVWLTGLSGSGKSTIANLLEQQLHSLGRHTFLLEGDNIRHGLNRDLGFTPEDRVQNIRRVAEVAALLVDAGLIVIVSLISPFRSERQTARERVGPGEFLEVFIDTPLDECERRDPKGLYRKAKDGKIPNFTGIDSPYEPPDTPELVIRTLETGAEAAAARVVALLRAAGKI